MLEKLGFEVNFELTYKWSDLQENIKKISTKDQYILIHILGNEARKIAKNKSLSEAAKIQEAMDLTIEFMDFSNHFAKKNPQKGVFFQHCYTERMANVNNF